MTSSKFQQIVSELKAANIRGEVAIINDRICIAIGSNWDNDELVNRLGEMGIDSIYYNIPACSPCIERITI